MTSHLVLPDNWPAMTIAEAHEILTAPGARFEMDQVIIRGMPTRVWKNAPPTLRDVLSIGRSHGSREFIVYEDDRATYDGFARAVLALAAELQAHGVAKGDRVALVMRNLPEWPVVFFAAVSIGAIVTPLNAWWAGAELLFGLQDSGARIAILDGERYARLGKQLAECPGLERVYVAREVPPGILQVPAGPRVQRLEDVIGRVSDWNALPEGVMPEVVLHPDDDATIFYTSGTSGKPKGALGTHRNICTNIGTAGITSARSFLRRGEQPPPPDPALQRTVLLVVPMFHVTGCSATLCLAVALGSRIVVMRRWDAEGAMKLIQAEQVTATGGVPTIAWQLIEHPARSGYDLSSLEGITYGGAPSAPELVRKIKEAFPKAYPGSGWGMSETSGTFTSHVAEDYMKRPDSCGPAAPVGDMKVVDPNGEPAAPGALGELWVRGPQVVKGYWREPAATAEAFTKEGWVKTGDLARIDEEGFCFIVDRAKDMLIRGGENIYCFEVESILYEHPAVMDAALVGVPHRTLGEEPAAVVTLKQGAEVTEQELRSFLASKLAAFKVPVKVVFWPETLPRNASGKILKTELRAIFADDASA